MQSDTLLAEHKLFLMSGQRKHLWILLLFWGGFFSQGGKNIFHGRKKVTTKLYENILSNNVDHNCIQLNSYPYRCTAAITSFHGMQPLLKVCCVFYLKRA